MKTVQFSRWLRLLDFSGVEENKIAEIIYSAIPANTKRQTTWGVSVFNCEFSKKNEVFSQFPFVIYHPDKPIQTSGLTNKYSMVSVSCSKSKWAFQRFSRFVWDRNSRMTSVAGLRFRGYRSEMKEKQLPFNPTVDLWPWGH